jgi:hypothetical protein
MGAGRMCSVVLSSQRDVCLPRPTTGLRIFAPRLFCAIGSRMPCIDTTHGWGPGHAASSEMDWQDAVLDRHDLLCFHSRRGRSVLVIWRSFHETWRIAYPTVGRHRSVYAKGEIPSGHGLRSRQVTMTSRRETRPSRTMIERILLSTWRLRSL